MRDSLFTTIYFFQCKMKAFSPSKMTLCRLTFDLISSAISCSSNPKQSQKSRSVLKDGPRFFGCFGGRGVGAILELNKIII